MGTAVTKAAQRQTSRVKLDVANEASKMARPERDQLACTSPKHPKSSFSSQSNKSSQIKSAISTSTSGLENIKTSLQSKENRPQTPRHLEDRLSVLNRYYQDCRDPFGWVMLSRCFVDLWRIDDILRIGGQIIVVNETWSDLLRNAIR